MQNALGVGLQVVCHGITLPEYTRNERTFVPTPRNCDYQIRVLLPVIPGDRYPFRRFLAVISVDGLDVMTGKRFLVRSCYGHIMSPQASPTANDIPGFQVDTNTVVPFHFGPREDSRLDQTDGTTGVIHAVFYSESEADRSAEPWQFRRRREVGRLTLECDTYETLALAGIIPNALME